MHRGVYEDNQGSIFGVFCIGVLAKPATKFKLIKFAKQNKKSGKGDIVVCTF